MVYGAARRPDDDMDTGPEGMYLPFYGLPSVYRLVLERLSCM